MKTQFIPGKPVTTTNFQSAQPLGVGGQLVLEHWEALYQILYHEVGPQCAGLLLEPVIDRQRGEVDWYLPSGLQTIKTNLDPNVNIIEQAHSLINQGRMVAQRLMQSADVEQQQKGALLQQALTYPSDNHIITTPYGPAIVSWGHQSQELDAKDKFVAAKGDGHAVQTMTILPPPELPIKGQGLLSLWPWIAGLILLLLLIFLPWWTGIIPIPYCRYYWLGPVILLLILLPVIGILLKNYYSRSQVPNVIRK
ncbi:hypothetical protein [Commensalibacter oyaizuii]|uniref:Uncharacterized protein n=1 Tax=Commensalibacter oyaizuii TaxID=3043873 RepID=A0ABT6PZ91_9PROT|nr:hypothetical protein [Commensalibacter sp. TBRC 16381]MDI2090171.1 hypothetical protein [Commensalibacter sp. TBRC 16381]